MQIEQLENGFYEARFRSMNSSVSVILELAHDEFDRVLTSVAHPFFVEFEQECSRFIANNPLAKLNQQPASFVQVPRHLYEAVQAAVDAYELTDGAFDPRIVSALKAVGYAESFNPAAVPTVSGHALGSDFAVIPKTRWQPQLRRTEAGGDIHLGGQPIDLGGIGKGLAVDLVTTKLKALSTSGLVNAGGDIQAWGSNPSGELWRVGVEDPFGGDQPVAVIQLADTGLATSSVRKRRWKSTDGASTHHLIDPKTGISTSERLQSVTVLHQNTRAAETITKAIFVAGAENAYRTAQHFGVPAFWVTDDGKQWKTEQMTAALMWVSQ